MKRQIERDIIMNFLRENNWLSLHNKENARNVVDVYINNYLSDSRLECIKWTSTSTAPKESDWYFVSNGDIIRKDYFDLSEDTWALYGNENEYWCDLDDPCDEL